MHIICQGLHVQTALLAPCICYHFLLSIGYRIGDSPMIDISGQGSHEMGHALAEPISREPRPGKSNQPLDLLAIR